MRRARRFLLGLSLGYALVVLARAVPRAELSAPPATQILYDRRGEFLAELGASDDAPLGFWPMDQVPARVAQATILIEDRRLGLHPGVDPLAVLRAVYGNFIHGRRISGASTLAMQVARMQDPGPRTWHKKVVEACTALLLTARHGNAAIVAHYLRLAPYANRIHGIRYAARRYLAKPVEDLSWAEIAYLAAIPQSPARMNPLEPAGHRRAQARGRRILALMAEAGLVPPPELALAETQLDALPMPYKPARPAAAIHAVLRAARAARGGPPLVQTTLDLGLLERAQAELFAAVERASAQGAGNGAVLVVDLAEGEVLAYLGSRDYFEAERAGAIDFAQVRRPAASTLKPLFFALGLERGVLSPASVLADLRRSRGGVENADERYLGPLLLRRALANSRNVPAVEVLERVGLPAVYDLFAELGLHGRERAGADYGEGLAIGTLPVTLESLAQAYLSLAREGRPGGLRFLQGAPAPLARPFSLETARRLALFLSDPEARTPTFPRLGPTEYPFPVAVKTGTSQGYRDAWTVAWSGRYLVAAWVGRADAQPMQRLSGINSAARLVRALLLSLHEAERDGLADRSFPPPPGQRPVVLCSLSGHPAGPHCPGRVTEWLRDDEVHPEPCPAHQAVLVDRRTGAPARADTPPGEREERVRVSLQPRFGQWLAELRREEAAGPAGGGAPVIVSPQPGARYLRDPEAPPEASTVGLEVALDSAPEQVLWSVDGAPFRAVRAPYLARWPLSPGRHVIQASIPGRQMASRPVEIWVE